MKRLEGKVAVVTGASRGAGRGIAVVLGGEGATVYVTGRSVRGGATTQGLLGTVDETAEEVTARGGIAVRCDHTVDSDVEALFARLRDEHGRLDVLVNNVWGGYELGFVPPTVRFWEHALDEKLWRGVFVAGLRAHLWASRLAVPLMLPHRRGLIVSTLAWDREKYLLNVSYDVAMHAIRRTIYGLALELRAHGIAAVAVAPGSMRTKRVLAVPAEDWPGGVVDLSTTESPEYVGRAVAALAADPDVMQRSGRAFAVGDLALEYGFTDVDGRQIPAFRIPDEYLMD